jgi:hypothetical protein
MAETRFGREATGEPQLIDSIRKGRSPSLKTLQHIAAFMDDRDGIPKRVAPVQSATNGAENIASETVVAGEADSPRPFGAGGEASPPTCSSTSPSSAASATSSPRPCSTGPAGSKAEAA